MDCDLVDLVLAHSDSCFPYRIIPLYLIYRPANSVPYGTVEADLKGVFLRYSLMDSSGRLIMRNVSLVEQKCCAFQHWIHQWTNGNLLATHLEGNTLLGRGPTGWPSQKALLLNKAMRDHFCANEELNSTSLHCRSGS